jgi:hypothetical protein
MKLKITTLLIIIVRNVKYILIIILALKLYITMKIVWYKSNLKFEKDN